MGMGRLSDQVPHSVSLHDENGDGGDDDEHGDGRTKLCDVCRIPRVVREEKHDRDEKHEIKENYRRNVVSVGMRHSEPCRFDRLFVFHFQFVVAWTFQMNVNPEVVPEDDDQPQRIDSHGDAEHVVVDRRGILVRHHDFISLLFN